MAAEGRRTYVVTGATSGIGRSVVENLVHRDFNVIGVGRSPERCAETLSALTQSGRPGKVEVCRADLSSQTEVRSLAVEIRQIMARWGAHGLDGLVNNAAAVTYWQTLTPEGFDTQWAVNHLAPFLLTLQLLPQLSDATTARVVTVSSGSHYGTKLVWDDLQLFKHYSPLRAYKQTKLANVLFTAELNRRLGPEASIQAFAADPGLVKTDIGRKTRSRLVSWLWNLRRRGGIDPQQAATGVVEILVDPSIDVSKGIYWKHGQPRDPSPYALEPFAGQRLWEISCEMCGIQMGD